MAAGMTDRLNHGIRALACGLLVLLLLAGPWAAAQEAGEPGADNDAPGQAEPPSTSTRLTISSGLGQRDLARRYPQQAVWLELGEGDSELALLALERDAVASGAMLIVGDEGQSAASGLHGAMRSLLADHGWAAMVLALPSRPMAPTGDAIGAERPEPAADESVMIDVAVAPDAVEPLQGYRERVQALLAAATAELSGRGYQRIVLVGVGQAALPVMQAAMGGTSGPRALVWVTPRFAGADGEAWQSGLEGLEAWSILDLANTLTGPEATGARAAVFARKGMTGYRQQRLLLSDPVSGRDAPMVVNRILAWLVLAGDGASPY